MSRMNFDHVRWIADDPRPVIRVNPHDAGLVVAGGRIAADDNIYWRIAQFLMPVHAYAPSAMPGENMFGQTFVPVTDTTCWIYTYAWNPERPIKEAERALYKGGNGVIAEVDENYVPLRHRGNDYLIDRRSQKTTSYTGIKGVSEQDAAVQDSQGPIADRTQGAPGPHRHRHPALPQAHDGPGARPHARQGAAVRRLRRALPGARRRLHHAQVQGPRHRHDRALRRPRGLRRRSRCETVSPPRPRNNVMPAKAGTQAAVPQTSRGGWPRGSTGCQPSRPC